MVEQEILCVADQKRFLYSIRVPEYRDQRSGLLNAIAMICEKGIRDNNNNILHILNTKQKQQLYIENAKVSSGEAAELVKQGGSRAIRRNKKKKRIERITIRLVTVYEMPEQTPSCLSGDDDDEMESKMEGIYIDFVESIN